VADVETEPPPQTAEELLAERKNEMARKVVAEFGETMFLFYDVGGPFSHCYRSLTFEGLYEKVIEDPSLVHAIAERPMGECPFSPEGAPIEAMVSGRQIPGYGLVRGWAGELPCTSWARICSDEPLTELTLIPYGRTNLRITEFPLL